MAKKFVKRTDANNETLYFYTHSDVVDVGEGNATTSLTNALNNKANTSDVQALSDDALRKSPQSLSSQEKSQVHNNIGTESFVDDRAVRYDDAQVLGSEEKTQALTNLGLNGVDENPTKNSTNMVRSGGVAEAIDDVQYARFDGIQETSVTLNTTTTATADGMVLFYVPNNVFIYKVGSTYYTLWNNTNRLTNGFYNDSESTSHALTTKIFINTEDGLPYSFDGIDFTKVVIDEEPTPNSDNLVKSGGVEKELPVFHLTGNGNNVVYSSYFGVKAGNTYRLWVNNPDVSMSGITRTTATYKRFAVSAYDESKVLVQEYIIDVGCDEKNYNLLDYYDITIPNDASFIQLLVRAALNEVLSVVIEDITDSIGLKETVSRYEVMTASEVMDRCCVKTSGLQQNINSFDVYVYAVEENTLYAFSDNIDAGQASNRFVSWWNSDRQLISIEPYKGNPLGGERVYFRKQAVKSPLGAAYAYLSGFSSHTPPSRSFMKLVPIKSSDLENTVTEHTTQIASHTTQIASNTTKIEANKQEIFELEESLSNGNPLTPIEVKDNYYVSSNGLEAQASYNVYVFEVEAGKLYSFSDNIDAGYTSNRFLSWWDTDSQLILIEPYKGNSSGRVTYKDQPVKAPEGAAYAYLSGRKAHAYPYRNFKEQVSVVSEMKDTILATASSIEMTHADPIDGYVDNTGEHHPSATSGEEWKYNVEPNTTYLFSGRKEKAHTPIFLTWWDEEDVFIGAEPYKGSMDEAVSYKNQPVVSPSNAAYAILNVQKSNISTYRFARIGNYIRTEDAIKEVMDVVEQSVSKTGSLKVTINSNKSFNVRFHIDDELDGLLFVGYYSPFNFSKSYPYNSIMHRRFYVGGRDESDSEITAQYNTGEYHNCYDTELVLGTSEFGPIFANHGLSIPEVIIANHSLTSEDIGSEWVDQLGRDYTIGKIDGNKVYLLPIIHSTGVPGEETRGYKSYNSTDPTQITRNVAGGETLLVSNTLRYDFQLAETPNITILVDGVEKPEGEYYCKELVMTCEQMGYNPVHINTWVPRPDFTNVDTMAVFRRQHVFSGSDGFLSLAVQTTIDVQYPVKSSGLFAIGVMLPTAFKSGYDSWVYIPKTKKDSLAGEFISNSATGSNIALRKNAEDIDLDNYPDRAYAYLKHTNDGSSDANKILVACAGGVSLLRGMTRQSVKSENITGENPQVTRWSPSSGNKYYIYCINKDVLFDTSTFIEFETFMCWYKPENDVQSFFYKEGNDYILYIHTKSVHAKEAVKVPMLMNGLSVKSVVEQSSNNISYLNDIIVDGKLYINSGSDYEYIVLKIG